MFPWYYRHSDVLNLQPHNGAFPIACLSKYFRLRYREYVFESFHVFSEFALTLSRRVTRQCMTEDLKLNCNVHTVTFRIFLLVTLRHIVKIVSSSSEAHVSELISYLEQMLTKYSTISDIYIAGLTSKNTKMCYPLQRDTPIVPYETFVQNYLQLLKPLHHITDE